MPSPNLIERLENLRAALDEALSLLPDDGDHRLEESVSLIDTADGIAFEMLTMIDGR